jgi:hypothetical protein
LTSAAKYIAKLPPPVQEPELDGCTEEDVYDDLRDPDSHEMPAYTKPTQLRAE